MYGVNFFELAQILLDAGVQEAMAFDPGGSATLWIDGSVRNIPPFNPHYQKTSYCAPPMARGVANGILITS
ncbi:phosphodiester glycosidase family protein [Patescibacteria group bacterium]|nr:phosphodiester glycosidase family protein [Patescibacteria group bacterium]